MYFKSNLFLKFQGPLLHILEEHQFTLYFEMKKKRKVVLLYKLGLKCSPSVFIDFTISKKGQAAAILTI